MSIDGGLSVATHSHSTPLWDHGMLRTQATNTPTQEHDISHNTGNNQQALDAWGPRGWLLLLLAAASLAPCARHRVRLSFRLS